MRRILALLLAAFFIWIAPNRLLPRNSNISQPDVSNRIHVYCECYNSWKNGRVENFADVDLRDGTSFGPVLFGATVEVNGQKLAFDEEE